VVQIGGFRIPATLATGDATDPAAEWRRLDEALQKLIAFYERQSAAAGNKIEIEMYQAHRAIARDPELRRVLREAVFNGKTAAASAIAGAESHFSAMLAASGSELMRERALDVQDVCFQLLRLFYGEAAGAVDIQLTEDSLVIAASLAPSRFLALDRNFLKGLVIAQAGTTSHSVILARAFGIPTLTGVTGLLHARLDGQEAVVDAEAGLLLTKLDEVTRRYYALEHQRLTDRQGRLQRFAQQPATTQDGQRIEVAANISGVDEAVAAFAAGAEGIGLFRTEMLFLDRPSAPGEETQFEAYRRVLAGAKGRPVIIRTLDVGGDKPLPYLIQPAEENPFLGCRAVRMYPRFEPLFRTQIRALVRASASGPLKIMIPMISTVEEARWVRKIVAEEQARCAAERLAFDAAMSVGAMIEVPAAAFAVKTLCRELDFFSIGSNDLLQYFMAVDRANASVAGLYTLQQPAFLGLLKQIVEGAHAQKKWIGLCGEMAGQTRLLPLLVGLGLDEISMAAPDIAAAKFELTKLRVTDCRNVLDAALDCATVEGVETKLENFAIGQSAPLLDPELMIPDADAATKEEAIKLAVDKLFVMGRVRDSRAVEEAVWQREQTYTTGFGHGFAIPHCKSNAVQSHSLVLIKLRTPVPWGSLDNQPVRVVILLAIGGTDAATEHMKLLAKLARKLMDEEFRSTLEQLADSEAICGFLGKSLQV
jgi:fructose-specific PTS system IIA-like component